MVVSTSSLRSKEISIHHLTGCKPNEHHRTKARKSLEAMKQEMLEEDHIAMDQDVHLPSFKPV
jgi:hypothetical protein